MRKWTRTFRSFFASYKPKHKVYEGQTIATQDDHRLSVIRSNAFWIYGLQGPKTYCWETDSGKVFWPDREKPWHGLDIDWGKTKKIESDKKKESKCLKS